MRKLIEGRELGAVLLASLVLKLLVVGAVADLECQGDQCSFLHAARSVLAGQGFDYGTTEWDAGHTPPLYVLFLSAALAVGGDSLTAVRILQALISLVTCWLVHRIALRWLGRRAALIAAGLTAFFPELLSFFQYAHAENLFLLLLAGLVLAALRLQESGRIRDAAFTGLMLGLCALTRSMMLYFVVPLVAWLVLTRRSRWRSLLAPAAATVLVMLGTIAPWTAYNHARFDRLLLLATNAGNVLLRNLNFTAPENYDYKSWRVTAWTPDRPVRPRCQDENPVDRYRCEVREARAFVLENPGRTAHYAWLKLRALWNPSSFVVRYLCNGAYGEIGQPALGLWALLFAGSTVTVVLLGTAGMAGGPTGPVRSLLLTVFLYFHAVHGLAIGMSRYRVPLLLVVLIGAAAFLDRPRACLAVARNRRSNVLLLPWLVVIGSSWWLYAPILFRLP